MSTNTSPETEHETKAARKIPTPNIGILPAHLKEMADLLNVILADEAVLYTKTRKSHWNVTGIHFHDQHEFFETMYLDIQVYADDVAERVRKLGHHAIGTMKDFLATTHLLETTDTSDDFNILHDLLNDHETIIRVCREAAVAADEKYKDAGTNDFLINLMQKHEKYAWMLRSMLS